MTKLFWNMLLYFKMMRLPFWILDQDFTENHIKVQTSWINKYLPWDKKPSKTTGLDSSKLMRLAEGSPNRFGTNRSRGNSIASSDSQKDQKALAISNSAPPLKSSGSDLRTTNGQRDPRASDAY